jgi:thioredoxin
MMPGVHQLEEKYNDKIKFASFNIAEGRRIAMKLKVLGLPAVKIVKAGEIVAGIGPDEATSVDAIENFIKGYYETI